MKFSSYLSGALTIAFIEALLFEIASGIDCYQCTSIDQDNPFQCNEYMTEDIDIAPVSCDDVYGAAFCIKQVGRFDVGSIDCYQCSTPDNIDCGDVMIHDQDGRSIQPVSCNHIFEARYCIKTTGVHGGGLGTKRFCSSLDLGNYCNYIKQPGDVLEYRSCVYTCSSDGCNSSTTITVQPLVLCASLAFSWLLASCFKL